MNRPIKFRAWDKKGRKWLRDFSVHETGALLHLINSIEEDPDIALMQFTGLTDKNGREIYEGDIIETLKNMFEPDGETERHEVVFERGMFKTKDGVSLDVSAGVLFKPVVVANIYENEG